MPSLPISLCSGLNWLELELVCHLRVQSYEVCGLSFSLLLRCAHITPRLPQECYHGNFTRLEEDLLSLPPVHSTGDRRLWTYIARDESCRTRVVQGGVNTIRTVLSLSYRPPCCLATTFIVATGEYSESIQAPTAQLN